MNVGTLEALLRLRDELSPALKVAGRNVEQASKKLDKMGAASTKLGTSILPISAALGLIGVASIKFANDLNKSMAEISTLIPGATDRVLELKGAVQELGVAHGKSAQEQAKGLYQVISAFGDQAGQTIKILEINSKAATAGVATTVDAINLTSAVTKGYGDTTAEAVQKASDLAFVTVKLGQTTFPELASAIGSVIPIAATLGVEQEELFAGFATLTGVTGTASEVSTQLAGALRAILKPSNEMTAAVGQLGFATGEAMIRQLGLVGSMQALIGTTDGTKEAVGELFTRAEAMNAVFALSGSQAETFATKLQAMQNTAGATETAFLAMTEGINKGGFTLEQLKAQLEVVAQNIGDQLVPVIVKFVEVLKPMLDGVVKAAELFGQLPGPIQEMVIVFGALVVAAGPALILFGLLASGVAAMGTAIVGAGGAIAAAAIGPAMVAIASALGVAAAAVVVATVSYKAAQEVFRATGITAGIIELTDAFTVASRAAAEAGRSVTENLTPAQREGLAIAQDNTRAYLAEQAALDRLRAAAGSAAAPVAALGQSLAEEVKAAQAATVESTALADATEILGRAVIDPAEAFKVLALATKAGGEAVLTYAQRVEQAADRIRASKIEEEIQKLAEILVNGLPEISTPPALTAVVDELNERLGDLDPIELDLPQEEIEEVVEATLDWEFVLNTVLDVFEILGVSSASVLGNIVASLADGVVMMHEFRDAWGEAGTNVDKVNAGVGALGGLMSATEGGGLGAVGGGAAYGAQAGAAFGPYGAIIGGVAGGLVGLGRNIFGADAEEEVNVMRDAFLSAQGGWESFQQSLAGAGDTSDLLKDIFDAETVDEFNAAVGAALGLLDSAAFAQDAVNAAVDKYNFSIEELGPAWQQQELDSMAASLLGDYELLTAGLVDQNAIIRELGPGMLEFLAAAQATGSAVPEAMRPMVEALIASGQLVDENGDAFANAEDAGITFTETLSEGLRGVIDAIKELVATLQGIPPVTVPVNFQPGAFPDIPGARDFSDMDGIPRFGVGGIVTQPTLAVIGESGPEAVVPLGRRSAAGDAIGAGGGDITIEFNIHAPSGNAGDIREAMRGAMPEFLSELNEAIDRRVR